MVDMNFWLARKYAMLQQQADATTKNAATGAMTGAAAARVDNTRADLMPAESRAGVAKTQAETGLVNENTKWFGPEAQARIGKMGAETGNINADTAFVRRTKLTDNPMMSPLMQTIYGKPGAQAPGMGGANMSASPAAVAAWRKPRMSWTDKDLDAVNIWGD